MKTVLLLVPVVVIVLAVMGISGIGTTPYLRDVATGVMNAQQGWVDNKFNESSLKKRHLTEPLPNFGTVNPVLYRGGEPSAAGYRLLKGKYGITDVVNLRMENDERKILVQQLGIRHHYIPIPDTCGPSWEQASEFVAIVAEVSRLKGKVFVHCAGGVGRTGTMVGAIRLRSGWSLQEVRKEMEAYGWQENWFKQRYQWDFLKAYPASLGK